MAGPPFIRYHVIDMQAELEIELGVPAGVPAGDGGRIRPGIPPAGRHVVLGHVGPYDGLVADIFLLAAGLFALRTTSARGGPGPVVPAAPSGGEQQAAAGDLTNRSSGASSR